MRLPRSFYHRPTVIVAQDLLGKFIVHKTKETTYVGRINEVEAYTGSDDPASHAFRGFTPRNLIMFDKPGLAYIYFIYGMYYCLNLTTEAKGTPGAVLIRSVIPLESSLKTDGPGKLCRAFHLNLAHNGIDLTTSRKLWLEDRGDPPPEYISTPRIGIKVAKDKLRRFVVLPTT